MVLPTTNNKQFKKEGTSQTYGQLILFPSKKDNVISVFQPTTTTPKDVIVKLIPNVSSVIQIGDIDDSERSKISLAAFSDSAQKNVPITINQTKTNVSSLVEAPQREKVNISDVTQNIENYAIVVGSAYKTSQELKTILKEASKVDMLIALKSKFSEDVSLNNLKQTTLQSKFTYNFYIPQETDVRTQEDQSQDPLLTRRVFDVPRYVKLTWKKTSVTEQLKTNESDFTSIPKATGIVGYNSYAFKDSFINNQKKTTPLVINGRQTELVDINGLDKAFDALVNGLRFSNAIVTVLSSIGNALDINKIPITGQISKK